MWRSRLYEYPLQITNRHFIDYGPGLVLLTVLAPRTVAAGGAGARLGHPITRQLFIQAARCQRAIRLNLLSATIAPKRTWRGTVITSLWQAWSVRRGHAILLQY